VGDPTTTMVTTNRAMRRLPTEGPTIRQGFSRSSWARVRPRGRARAVSRCGRRGTWVFLRARPMTTLIWGIGNAFSLQNLLKIVHNDLLATRCSGGPLRPTLNALPLSEARSRGRATKCPFGSARPEESASVGQRSSGMMRKRGPYIPCKSGHIFLPRVVITPAPKRRFEWRPDEPS
jgi:hypothetical protein